MSYSDIVLTATLVITLRIELSLQSLPCSYKVCWEF